MLLINLHPLAKTRRLKREAMRRYKERHPGVVEAASMAARAKNPEKYRLMGLANQKDWRRLNSDKYKLSCRKTQLKCKYGLTIEDEAAMIAAQNNCCAVCGAEFGEGKRRNIDHHHGTNIVRGIVCTRCNRSLVVVDDESLLNQLLAYRDRHKK